MPKIVKVIDEDALVVRHIWAMELYSRLCAEVRSHTYAVCLFTSIQVLFVSCLQQSAARGVPITKVTVVFDLAHLSLSPNSTAMAIFKATVDIDQHFYPERLHQAYFINSPWIFKGLWAVISPWLDPVTKAKVRLLCVKHVGKSCSSCAFP